MQTAVILNSGQVGNAVYRAYTAVQAGLIGVELTNESGRRKKQHSEQHVIGRVG